MRAGLRFSAAGALLLFAAGCASAAGPGTDGPVGPSTGTTADVEAIFAARQDSARARFTNADVEFVRGMIGHHAQALLMAELASSRASSSAVRTLAARIDAGQRDEIAVMEQWLRDRGQPVPQMHVDPGSLAVHGAEHAAGSPGMLTAEQLESLARAGGTEFDRLFLSFMIQHHRGAVAMVEALFATEGAGREEVLFRLASDVQVDQLTEIRRMEAMLAALPVDGAP